MWCEQAWRFIKRHSTVPGVVVVFALTFIIMLAVDAGEVGAAWVQAFGSIAAIAAGFWVAYWQKNQQEKAALQERRLAAESQNREKHDYMERASYAAVFAISSIGLLVNHAIDSRSLDDRQLSIYLRQIQRASTELDVVSIVELGSSRVVDAWLGFKRIVYLCEISLADTLEKKNGFDVMQFSDHLTQALIKVEHFDKAVRAYVEQNPYGARIIH